MERSDMREISLQSIYNKVKKHLLNQNQKSIDADGDCVYRGPEGLKCAVGCLIPDKLYNENFEGKSARTIFEGYYSINIIGYELPKRGLDLIAELQCLHDDFSIEEWASELEQIAIRFELKA